MHETNGVQYSSGPDEIILHAKMIPHPDGSFTAYYAVTDAQIDSGITTDSEAATPLTEAPIPAPELAANQPAAIEPTLQHHLGQAGLRQVEANAIPVEPTVTDKIAKLYKNPWYRCLRPGNIELLQGSNLEFEKYSQPHDPDLDPLRELEALIVAPHPDPLTTERRIHIATLLAAASVRKNEGADTAARFKHLLHDPTLRQVGQQFVLSNLPLFTRGNIGDISKFELEKYGLKNEDIAPMQNTLPQLDEPPLVLVQLAADAVSRHEFSVFAGNDSLSKFSKRIKGERPETDTERVLDALGDFLGARYEFVPSPALKRADRHRLWAALAECHLAEREGFLTASPEVQYRFADRVRTIFAKVDFGTLPSAARGIVEQCQVLRNRPTLLNPSKR